MKEINSSSGISNKLTFLIITIFLYGSVAGQSASDPFVSSRYKLYNSFKLNASFFLNGGCNIGIGYGFSARGKVLQPALNISLSARIGKKNLGNSEREYTGLQFNTIVSPLLTVGIYPKYLGYFEEINPAYFGNVTGVHSNYRHSITLGSSFVVMPRGLGKNIETNRNRTQQLIYAQLRTGWKYRGSENSPDDFGSFQLNLYEDFLFTDNDYLQGFADNFDRFFTGGGNVQLRINKNIQAKFYTEVYTGNNYRDDFDYPDWVDSVYVSNKENRWGRAKKERLARYAYQDAGQQRFNKGRSFFMVDYSPTPDSKIRYNYHLMFGWQRKESMWSQNFIHSRINKINKALTNTSTDNKTLINKSKEMDRLHFFYPSNTDGHKFIWGMGAQFQTY